MAKKRQEKSKVLIFTPERKIVVLWRSSGEDYRPDEIDVAGGRRDYKRENPLHTAVRETFEEIGIRLDPKAMVHLRRHQSRSNSGKVTDVYGAGLAETPTDDQIVLSSEHQRWGLMPESEFLESAIAEKYKLAITENPQEISGLIVPRQAEIVPVQFDPAAAQAQLQTA